jgi:hypothetical protein
MSMPGRDAKWPEWPRPRRGKIPPSFSAYEDRLKRILGGRNPHRKVRRLPPLPKQLAEEGNQIREFKALVADLFGRRPHPEYEPQPYYILAALLFRSGYYHALIARESTREIRQRVVDKIQYGRRARSCLWLLGGCKFARSFRIFGMSVEPFTPEQLDHMSPEPRGRMIRETEERELWFLVDRDLDVLPDGWVGKEEWEQFESKKDDERARELESHQSEADEILAKLQRRPKTDSLRRK